MLFPLIPMVKLIRWLMWKAVLLKSSLGSEKLYNLFMIIELMVRMRFKSRTLKNYFEKFQIYVEVERRGHLTLRYLTQLIVEIFWLCYLCFNLSSFFLDFFLVEVLQRHHFVKMSNFDSGANVLSLYQMV